MRSLVARTTLVLFGALQFSVPNASAGPATGYANGVVVAAHPFAASAGAEVLRGGGNAIDAFVAASFVIAVVEPQGSGLGGGGFAVTWDLQRVEALDFREKAPKAATRDMYLVEGKADTTLSQDGGLSVGVPGMVQGMWDLHQKYGSKPWHELLTPAVEVAKNGVEVNPLLQDHIQRNVERFNAAAKTIFMPGGNVPSLGSRLVQKDLADTLQRIADSGPSAFYSGSIAQRMLQALQAASSPITAADLRDYHTVWRKPIVGEFMGHTVYSMPPPSSGGIHLIQMLRILEPTESLKRGFHSAASLHPQIEAMRFAFADRSKWLGDPDFFDVPVQRLLSDEHLATIRKTIQQKRSTPSSAIEGAPAPKEGHDTTHISVVDRTGKAVAGTLTINLSFGSGLVAGNTGIVMNDEMDDFAAAPGVPNAFGLLGSEANAIAPGKRPLSSMTPTLVLDSNQSIRMVAGSPGGSRIITSTLQVILHVLAYGMDGIKAVSVPRFHNQWYPPQTFIEPHGFSEDTLKILESRGHRFAESTFMGNTQVITVDPKTRIRYGASDPRGIGSAAGH